MGEQTDTGGGAAAEEEVEWFSSLVESGGGVMFPLATAGVDTVDTVLLIIVIGLWVIGGKSTVNGSSAGTGHQRRQWLTLMQPQLMKAMKNA